MQVIPREMFMQLVKKPDLVEAESGFVYEDFVVESMKIYVKYGTERIPAAYSEIKTALLQPKCPPIAFAGEGSSRAAFALEGGKCLKIAKKKAGIA